MMIHDDTCSRVFHPSRKLNSLKKLQRYCVPVASDSSLASIPPFNANSFAMPAVAVESVRMSVASLTCVDLSEDFFIH